MNVKRVNPLSVMVVWGKKKPAVLPQRVSSVTLGGVANLSTDQKLIWVRKEITRSLSVTPEPAAVYGDVSSMMTF